MLLTKQEKLEETKTEIETKITKGEEAPHKVENGNAPSIDRLERFAPRTTKTLYLFYTLFTSLDFYLSNLHALFLFYQSRLFFVYSL